MCVCAMHITSSRAIAASAVRTGADMLRQSLRAGVAVCFVAPTTACPSADGTSSGGLLRRPPPTMMADGGPHP